MKKAYVLLAATLIAAGVAAQENFFPEKEGVVQVYATSNAKGKVQAQTRLTITGVSGSAADRTIAYTAEVLDDKGKAMNPPQTIDLQVQISDGAVVYDMKSMFAAGSIANMKVEAKGTPMVIPSNIQPGETIPDSEAQIQIAFMKMSCVLTDGKCLAIEDITVPAGTFTCTKMTQTSSGKALGIKGKSILITWYAKGVGIVKQETYTDKDKLQSVQELISMTE